MLFSCFCYSHCESSRRFIFYFRFLIFFSSCFFFPTFALAQGMKCVCYIRFPNGNKAKEVCFIIIMSTKMKTIFFGIKFAYTTYTQFCQRHNSHFAILFGSHTDILTLVYSSVVSALVFYFLVLSCFRNGTRKHGWANSHLYVGCFLGDFVLHLLLICFCSLPKFLPISPLNPNS